MTDGCDWTTWAYVDGTEGAVRGTIAIVEDSQISTFRADNADYFGVDVTRKIKKHSYESRGFIMSRGVKLSSWSLHVTRSASGNSGRRSGKEAKKELKAPKK